MFLRRGVSCVRHIDRTAGPIVDVATPGMSGLELQRKLRQRDDETHVVFIARQDEATGPRALQKEKLIVFEVIQ